jgi:putative ATPase
MPEPTFYVPTDRGLEAKIRDKLAHLEALDAEAEDRRGED